MTDSSPLEIELTGRLRSRADSADPPPDAWDRFLRVRGGETDGSTSEIFASAQFVDLVPIQIEPNRGSHEMAKPNRVRMNSSRGRVLLVAAALVLAVVGVGVVIATDDADSEGDIADVATVAEAETPLDVMNDYFTAFGLGDVDAMMSLFSPEATFSEKFLGSQTASEFEALAVWNLGQRTERLGSQCTANRETGKVVCTYEEHTYLSRVVGGPAVPITTTASVVDGQITAINNSFGFPDYNFVNVPFDAWIGENYPDVADRAGCCSGATVEEARANGELRAEYADLWDADLRANLCTYNVPCDVNPMSDYFAAFEAGDVDAVMALFSEDATFDESGISVEMADDFEAFTAWDVAQRTIRLNPQCSAGDQMRQVICTYSDHQYLSRTVGGQAVPTTITATIVGGKIVAIGSVFGGPSYSFVNVPFDLWIAKNFPEVFAQTRCCTFSSVDEAQTNGALRVQYADLWAAYLEDNDCDYFDTDC